LSHGRRSEMIEPSDTQLSIVRQCALLSISRSSHYFQGRGESPLNLKLMRLIDEQFMIRPSFGSRQMARWLRRAGYCIGRKRVRRLMRKMCLTPIFQGPKTSTPNSGHRIYPYLLRSLEIDQPNQVWTADITYIPMARGFLYLVAIMDWHSRRVLAWRLSNTMEASFCVEALEEAISRYGAPQIVNTDQGSQFTSSEWIETVQNAGAKVSMDGKCRWVDNVMIERFWRSLKYECVYLHAYDGGASARKGIGDWLTFYNVERPHSTFDGRTPDEVYNGLPMQVKEPREAA
jgi:putative transposase